MIKALINAWCFLNKNKILNKPSYHDVFLVFVEGLDVIPSKIKIKKKS
jgi:hypothetical protein